MANEVETPRSKAKREWIAASRAQRAAYFAWQNASGDQVLPALDAYRAANQAQKEIEEKTRAR